MGKLPRVTGKEMIRFLEKQGFMLRRVRGSHHLMTKGPLHVAVPIHDNSELRIGTLGNILRQATMKSEEFERLWRES